MNIGFRGERHKTLYPRWTRYASSLLVIALVLVIGFALRVGGLVSDERFHPDEALFSTFARRAALNGDWLLQGNLDKPPLAIYAISLSMTLFAAQPRTDALDFTVQQGEFAARLPSLFASVISIAALYATGQRLFPQTKRAIWVSILFAGSPLLIVFAATAFTDGLMLCAGALALLAISKGRWEWAGFWMGAAFAAKQQGILFLPLVMGIGWIINGISLKYALRLITPLSGWLIALALWDGLRDQAVGFWVLAAANNEVSRWIRADEGIPRLTRWGVYLSTLYGAAVVALIPALIVSIRGSTSRDRLIDRLCLWFVLCYTAAHWLIAFNTYDRYALPLILPMSLLMSRSPAFLQKIAQSSRYSPLSRRAAVACLGIVSGLLVWSAISAADGRVGIGGDGGEGRRGRTTGIDQAAAYLNDKPVATVIYDHWLGWELGFYLGEWTDKRRVYFPTPRTMGEGAAELQEVGARYFIAPRDQPIRLWIEALEAHEFSVVSEVMIGQVVIYRVDPPPP